jgi:hypothetical protein
MIREFFSSAEGNTFSNHYLRVISLATTVPERKKKKYLIINIVKPMPYGGRPS